MKDHTRFNSRPRIALVPLLLGWVLCTGFTIAGEVFRYARLPTWHETVLAGRSNWRVASATVADRGRDQAAWWEQLQDDFPIECDWALQDGGLDIAPWFERRPAASFERQLLERVTAGWTQSRQLRQEMARLNASSAGPEDPRWLEIYAAACAQRRSARLETLRVRAPRIVFTKRRTIRPSFFAYTEGQSDAQNERHFLPGSELCVLELDGDGRAGSVRTLLSDPEGAIRDPAVSWDGERVVFAWKKSLDADDYHLYELTVRSGAIQPITTGLGFADYEPAYLPNGDLVFASSRCVQTVDCWWTEVSNLYTCAPDGRFLRRLGFDQVHTVFPQVLEDGRVIYTRWDYNDRGQVFPQSLFQMHADGTGQSEFYGNNSWFPTTIAHARGIPGTGKVMAILCGHHTSQAGKIAVIDPALGREENQGVQLVAPVRATRAERIDAYGQSGELWQYPFPLNEREFLTGYAPRGWTGRGRRQNDADFSIYWMDVDGRRELLVRDPKLPCQQPVALVARQRPPIRSSPVDYAKETGTYYMQDVYAGPGLEGIPRGTVARIRVIGLEFRPAGVGNNGSSGPGGGALISTPVSIGNGTWDVKVVLGETPVRADGSAYFKVPARTPLYFQAIDGNGHAVQTMRSWSTLQPGENQACVGCHEHKNAAPPSPAVRAGLAMKDGPRELEPFYGPRRGFSFTREIQPILDRHCIGCHDRRDLNPARARLPHALTLASDPDWTAPHTRSQDAAAEAVPAPASISTSTGATNRPAFSLLGVTTLDRLAKRQWSDAYLNLTLAQPADHDWDRGSFLGTSDGLMVNWISSQSIPAPLPPYAAGASRSELFPLLARGHYGVRLSREDLDKLACWIDLLVPYCGDYMEANAWDEDERQKFEHYVGKRRRMEELERQNLDELRNHRDDAVHPEARMEPNPRGERGEWQGLSLRRD